MKLSLSCLLLFLAVTLSAQISTDVEVEVLDKPRVPDPDAKMPCDPSSSLMFLSVELEGSTPGNNDADDGAFMRWSATGSSTGMYYNQIVSTTRNFETQIVRTNTGGRSVFLGGNDNTIDINVIFGGSSTNSCTNIIIDTYIIRVWEVKDDDMNGRPDTDANGDIIGCFIESEPMEYRPTCPPNDPSRLGAVVEQPSCTNGGGSISLNLATDDFYCVGTDQGGENVIEWMGPGVSGSSSTDLTGLEPGEYTVTVTDFYGCITSQTFTIEATPEVMITCPFDFTAPSGPGVEDGMATIDISGGSGDYTVNWSGMVSNGSQPAGNGPFDFINLSGPGAITITVVDNETGCEAECVLEPPCLAEFEVTLDEDNELVTVTILGGFAPFTISYEGPNGTVVVSGVGYDGLTLPSFDFPPGGTYLFVLEEENNSICAFDDELMVPAVDCSGLTITANQITDAGCSGNSGMISVTVTPADANIVWEGPGLNNVTDVTTLTDLGPGTYTIFIDDGTGNCQRDSAFTIAGETPLSISCGGVNETLAVLDNGKIGFAGAGGVGPYTITYQRAGDAAVGPNPTTLTDSLRNLPAGDYTITLRDSRDCPAVCTVTITEPNCDIATTCTPTNPVNVGGTGSVDITFDGIPNWTVDLNGPTPSNFVTATPMNNLDNLQAGTYTLEVFNSEGCTGSCTFEIEAPTCALTVTNTARNPQCVGNADGQINLDITGAAAGLTIDWDNDAFDGRDTVRNLVAGTYTVSVSDQTGCPVPPLTITLTDPAPVVVTLSEVGSIACNGDSTGTINAAVMGGVGALSYDWSVDSLPNAAQVSGLVAGLYFVAVTDENGCVGVDTIRISQPDVFSISCSAVGETAAGAVDGMLTIGSMNAGGRVVVNLMSETANLGIFEITGDQDTTFTNLAPGNYTTRVINGNGCTDECTVTISQGGCDITVSINETQPNCDNATGSATAVAMLANGAVTYAWSSGQDTPTINNLAPGTYTVVVTDELNCMNSASVTIDAFTDFPGITNVAVSPVCDEDCTELSFVTSGPDEVTVSYVLTQGGALVGTPQFFTAPAGPQQITVCPATFGVTDFTNHEITILGTQSVGNGCVRTDNTAYPIEVTPLASGTFSPTICRTDFRQIGTERFDVDRPSGQVRLAGAAASGCDSVVNVALDFFPESTGTDNPFVCVGGSFPLPNGTVLDAGNLTGSYVIPGADQNGCDSTVNVTLSFFPESVGTDNPTVCVGDNFPLPNGTVLDADNLTGSYVIPGADQNGCDSTVNVTLSFFPESMGADNPTVCVGDNFPLPNGTILDADNLTGSYVIPGADQNGCDSTVNVTLSFYPENFGTDNPTVCVGDNFPLPNGTILDATNLTGSYVIAGADQNGCDSTVNVTLSFFPESMGTDNPIVCTGDNFPLPNGTVLDAGNMTGSYVIPGADQNGCDSTVNVSLSFFPESIGTLDTMVCSTATVTVGNEVFGADRPSGEVTLSGQAATGCDSTVRVNVSFFPLATGVLNETLCLSDSRTVGMEVFNVDRPTGIALLPGASVNGCDSMVAVNLSFFPQIPGVLDTTICAGTFFEYGGRTFDQAVTGEQVTLPFPTANGCDSIVNVTVRVQELSTVALSGSGVICADGQLSFELSYDGEGSVGVILSSNPAETVVVASGTQTFTRDVSVGTTVTILSAMTNAPCEVLTTGSINVTQSSLSVAVNVTSGDAIFAVECNGGSTGSLVAIAAGGVEPYDYRWRSGETSPTRDGLSAGSYLVIVTDASGCSADSLVTLREPELLATSVGELDASCIDTLPALVISDIQGGVGPYLITAGAGFRPAMAFPDTLRATPGNVTLQIEDANGCLLTQNFELQGPPEQSITLTPERPIITQGDSVEIMINSTLDIDNYVLTTDNLEAQLGTGTSFFVRPLVTTTYNIAVADGGGCSAEASVRVIVDDFVPVYAPTAFSPNEDGVNDVFEVFASPIVESFSNFNIFDRWGNLVYTVDGPISPEDVNWGWDGKNASGKMHNPGVFVYSVDVLLIDGRVITIKSDMVLMR